MSRAHCYRKIKSHKSGQKWRIFLFFVAECWQYDICLLVWNIRFSHYIIIRTTKKILISLMLCILHGWSSNFWKIFLIPYFHSAFYVVKFCVVQIFQCVFLLNFYIDFTLNVIYIGPGITKIRAYSWYKVKNDRK